MPVPANYNVVTRNPRLRDHVGAVGCERTVVGPTSCCGRRSVVRVGGATHNATTWCHDRRVAQDRAGFVPFEGDATPHVRCGQESCVTSRGGNELDWTTRPPADRST